MPTTTESKPVTHSWSAVLLLHIAQWAASQDEWPLSPRITLGRFAGSRFERVYHDLVRDRGLDEGEPLLHGAYALIVPQEGDYPFGRHDPTSSVEAVANLVALVAGRGLAWSRQIISTDDFRAHFWTHALHETYGQQDFLQTAPLVFTDDALGRLTRAWAGVEALGQRPDPQRLAAALGYFSQSWRAHGLDETCLYLAAALEALFAPPGTVGTPAAITRAVVRCVGGTADERARLGRLLEKFYEARVDLVAVPCREAAIDAVVAMFEVAARLLERILTTPELLAVFSLEAA